MVALQTAFDILKQNAFVRYGSPDEYVIIRRFERYTAAIAG